MMEMPNIMNADVAEVISISVVRFATKCAIRMLLVLGEIYTIEDVRAINGTV